jgi:hypothetical protein
MMHLMFCIFIPLKAYRCPQLLWTSVISCLESQRSFRRRWTNWLVLWKHTDVHNFGFLSCISHQAACFKVFCCDLSSTECRSLHLLLLIRSLNSRFWAVWHRSCLRNLYCGRLHIGWVWLAAAVNLFCSIGQSWRYLFAVLSYTSMHNVTREAVLLQWDGPSNCWLMHWKCFNTDIYLLSVSEFFWQGLQNLLLVPGGLLIHMCMPIVQASWFLGYVKRRSSEQGESATTFLWGIRIFWSFFLS